MSTMAAAIRWVYKLDVLMRWSDAELRDWRLVRLTMGEVAYLQVECWVSQAGWSTVTSTIDERKQC